MSRIILASSSPFRKALLTRLQLTFSIVSPEIDESRLKNETPSQLVSRLAQAKAAAVATSLETNDAVIIASDQVAVCDERILGKPGNIEKATQQLTFVSGKVVTFHTGLCVLNSANSHMQCDEVKYHVEFRDLTNEMIASYLKKEPAFNCAGSFKSEALGVALTRRMFGDDPTALIGLPLIRVTQMLEQASVNIL
ncbi:MAG TPA: septum formation inhibitor Maf [Gammaproteobacteria bacterium]|nr:septum formation inhibitor Maf [Gammaproteobacteria bacterium]